LHFTYERLKLGTDHPWVCTEQLRGVSAVWPAGVILCNNPCYGGGTYRGRPYSDGRDPLFSLLTALHGRRIRPN